MVTGSAVFVLQRERAYTESGGKLALHFLFYCRALTKPRNDFFCRVYTLNPDFLSYTLLNKCQYLLCPQQHIHCIAHGTYCMYTLDKTYCTAFYKLLHSQLSHLMMLARKRKKKAIAPSLFPISCYDQILPNTVSSVYSYS